MDLVDSMTPELAQERAYRRGFHHGASAVADMGRRGATEQEIDAYLARVAGWRNDPEFGATWQPAPEPFETGHRG